MKKIIFLFILLSSFFLFNCSDEEETQFFFEKVPVESVESPEAFIRNEESILKVSYQRPSDCHSFKNFNYEILKNQTTVTIINVVVEGDSICKGLGKKDIVELPLNFVAGDESSYIFRFWKGEDDEGNDNFETIEIPVIEE